MQDIQENVGDTVEIALPVLNSETLSHLALALGGSRALQIAASFFADADRRLLLLQRGETTVKELHEHAHALVSMAGHLGLMRFSALCLELQNGGRDNAVSTASSYMWTSLNEARGAVHVAVASGAMAMG